jgi:3-hydroxybutyryl-CoA dehydratase
LAQYFEDFELAAVNKSRGRTVTEADIVNFAGVSGDFVELHINEEYARSGPFGRRIAHGLLVLSIASGLGVRMNDISETVIAFYGIDRLRFVKPTFIGDTVHVVKKVIGRQEKSADRGILTFETSVMNQNNEPVIVYNDKLMIKRRT